MADQGLPLMAVPQQNPWTTAANDLVTVLAQKDAARRQALIDQATAEYTAQKRANELAQGEATIRKTNADTGLASAQAEKARSDAATADATRTAEASKHQQLGDAMDEMNRLMTDPNATPEQRQAQAMKVKTLGGAILSNTEAEGLDRAAHQKRVDDLVNQFNAAAPDSPAQRAIGMQLLGLGVNVPAAPKPQMNVVAPGSVLMQDGKPVFTNPAKTTGERPDDPELPNEFKSYLNTLPTTIDPATGQPLNMAGAMAKVQRGWQGPGTGGSLQQKYPQLDLKKVGDYLRGVYGDSTMDAMRTGNAPGGAEAPAASPTPAPTPSAETPNSGLVVQSIPLPGGPHQVRLGDDGFWHGQSGDAWKLEGGAWTRIK